MSLREIIAEVIRREGPVPFSRYMELCLYHPELGYYARPQEKFGKGGDFYTSSDVHAVFGRLLSRQFEEMWRMLDSPSQLDLIELGPGRGLFAQDVLAWTSKKFPAFASALRYRLVESSPALRGRLQQRFASDSRVSVVAELEDAAHQCGNALIVFGNEFFDAIPVEIVSEEGELRIAEKSGEFAEYWVEQSKPVTDFLLRYGVNPRSGERVETPIQGNAWMERIARCFEGRAGFALFIDYGYTREQQQRERHRDTLMTYRQHQTSKNPYEAPGDQDITAHVNFTAIEKIAESCGMTSFGLVTQSQLLLGIGHDTEFSDAFEECAVPQERVKVALQVKHLISPEALGEMFQALLLARGVEKDKAAQLSGLSFR